MPRLPIERAKRYGIEPDETAILTGVAGWFGGFTFEIHGQTQQIGTHHEPTLRQVCSAVGCWQEGFEGVHQQMIRRKLFKTEEREENVYIAAKRCDWLPTQQALNAIEYIFKETEWLYAPWATDEHRRPPTYRDGSELMPHRKGALVAKRSLLQLDQIRASELYPRVNLPNRPDVRFYGTGAGPVARVEVLTNHGNRSSWEDKFTAWDDPKACPTIWLFENRPGMVNFWNHLVRHGYIELDGGTFGGDPTNWPPGKVNARLRRSRDGQQRYTSEDCCWTIPGLLQADAVQVHEFAKANNIILTS